MLHPIHPRYRTLTRKVVRDDAETVEHDERRSTLDDMYRRIDEDLADL